MPDAPTAPMMFARTLLPLVQLPPAGYYGDTRRKTRFVRDPRPRPDLARGRRSSSSGATSPPSVRRRSRDVAAWAGVAQVDFAAWDRVDTVSYRDEQGRELLDLPGLPLPPASTPLPPRLLAHWDQAMLAHADRERIMPPELAKLQLTLSGTPDDHRRRSRGRELGPAARGRPRARDDRAPRRDRPPDAAPRSARRRCARPRSASPGRVATTSCGGSAEERQRRLGGGAVRRRWSLALTG